MPLFQNASTLFLLAVGMQSIQLIETESAADMHITHPLFDLIFFFGLLDDVEPHHAPACKETLEQIFFFILFYLKTTVRDTNEHFSFLLTSP